MILHGRNLIITAGGASIAAAKSCSIDIESETIKVASSSDGQWEHSIPGRKSWSVATNHLLTSIVDSEEMVGTTVTLRAQVIGKIGLPFDGFIDNPTLESGTFEDVPDAIVWDTTRHQFIAEWLDFRTGLKYYTSWPGSNSYANPSAGKQFYKVSNQYVYKMGSTDLVLEALQGTAIVKKWQAAGAVGSLATGSFKFEGSGPFAQPTT